MQNMVLFSFFLILYNNLYFIFRCTLYPETFDYDKSQCKSYFRQFGEVTRVIFKPKARAIVIEYSNENDYLNALSGPSEFEGHSFKVAAVS